MKALKVATDFKLTDFTLVKLATEIFRNSQSSSRVRTRSILLSKDRRLITF